MNTLIIFSFAALFIERVLEFFDWIHRSIFPPQEKISKALSEKILAYTGKVANFKQTYRQEIEKLKDHPLTDEELESLLHVSQGYVTLTQEECKDLVLAWRQYNEQRQQQMALKMMLMWILGFFLSFGFCILFDFHLLGPLGISKLVPAIEGERALLDYILTAVLLGSGTKPVHDIISMLGAK